MSQSELRKFSFAVFERLVEDYERIPLEKTLRLYDIPEALIKEHRIDREIMKHVFEYLRQ